MSYDNLDAQDRAICEAIEAGKDDGELVREFGVNADKINQFRSVVAENGDTPAEDGNVPAGEGEQGADAPVDPEGEGEQGANGSDAPAEDAKPEGEADEAKTE